MAEGLDPVVQTFIANTTQWVDAVDAATQAAAALAVACTDAVEASDALGASLDDTAASAERATRSVLGLQAAISSLHGRDVNVGVSTSAASAAANAAATAAMGDAAARATQEETRLAPALLAVAGAGRESAAATSAAAAAAGAAGAAAGRAWRPWWLFGNNWLTAIHWVLAGSAELLAVVVPALVALGAGALVAAQGAQNVQRHFTALYAATESTASAMHTTMGDVLGLGHALQTAQDAANPGVYEILGSAISAAKGHFADFAGAGLQVVHMFDEFAARVNVDLRGTLGGQLSAFLSGMVRDLQQLGQVLGNFGHALVNVFAAMPGLVHILLSMLEAVSRFVLVLSTAPAGLLTFAIAIEEVFRWGGLLLGLLVRLAGAIGFTTAFATGAGFITRFGAALLNLVGVGGQALAWMGLMVGRLAGIVPAAGAAGTAMVTLGGEMRLAAASMSPLMVAGVVAAIAALAYLAVKLASVKTATEQWIATSDQMVAKASDLNVLNTVYGQLAQTAVRLGNSQAHLATVAATVSRAGVNQAAGMKVQSQNSLDLANHLISLIGTANTVRSNINLLATQFHVSAAAALALANAAGINLQVGLQKGSVAAQIAYQQITNLRTGLGAMTAPIGVIGADMEAMGIQSQLAASKVGQVNQAMDQFVGTLTNGMGGLAQFESALNTMGHDTQATSVRINGAISSISRNATAMGFTLQGMGPKAQQSWQQFTQATQQAQSVIDTLRIGMAEGVVSFAQFKLGVQAAAGQLLPFAAKSQTARAIVSSLAQQAGFPATSSLRTLATQLGITGNVAKNKLTKDIEAAITRMSSLSTVARNLSAVVAGQLDSAMAGAIVKASGLDAAYLKWANDVRANKAPATLAADLNNIRKAQDFVNTAEAKGTKILDQSAGSALKHASAVAAATKNMGNLATATGHTTAQIAQHITKVDRAAGASSAMASKVAQLSVNMGNQSTATQRAGTQVQTLGRNAQTAATNVHNLGGSTQTAGGNAITAAGKMSTLAGNIHNVGAAALNAAGQVRGLATAIAGLQSKTVTLTVNTVTTTTHRQHGGPVMAGMPYTVGEAGRELFVPSQSGVILPADQTSHILASMHASAGAAAGGGGGVMEVHSHVHLDGKEIFKTVQRQAFRFQTRNAGARTGLLVPGNKIGTA